MKPIGSTRSLRAGRQSAGESNRSRPAWANPNSTILFGVTIALIMIIPGLHPDHPSSPRALASLIPSHPGEAHLRDAVASLSRGGGPAAGTPWACTSRGTSGTCAASASPPSAPSWSPLPVSPGGHDDVALAYDPVDGYVVLFGGAISLSAPTGFAADTWTYAKGLWTEIHPATAPSPRGFPGFAYDAKDHYMLLYGGANTTNIYSDTWSFAGGKWTKLAVNGSPGPLVGVGMCYDANDSYVLMFGGYNTTGSTSRASWSYVGGNWTRLPAGIKNPAPAARSFAQMAYDVRDGWVVLFGGAQPYPKPYLNDTWVFSGGGWRHLLPSSFPPGREAAGFAYDPSSGKLILFGGSDQNAFRSDSWAFSGGSWARLGPAFHPSARGSFGTADGAPGSPLLLFGGYVFAGLLNDTWTFSHLVWKHVVPSAPAGRALAAAQVTYDEADGYVLLFGGFNSVGTYGDTWSYAAGVWKHLAVGPSPPARSGGAMVYDQADGYVLLFGGTASPGSAYSDTWTYSNGSWTQLFLGKVHPVGRDDADVAYDAADGYVLLYSGYNFSTGFLNDTWTFLSGAWSPVYTAHNPKSLGSGAMTYDSHDGYVLLFGGSSPSREYNETWEYSAGTWYNLTSLFAIKHAPSVRSYPCLVDDSINGYVLLYGGDSNGGALQGGADFSDTWTYQNGVWTNITTSVHPTPTRQFEGAVYDASDTIVVLFGGIAAGPGHPYLSDSWLF